MKFTRPSLLLATVLVVLAVPARAAVETYAIDPVHSSVAFSIRHIVSKVPGSFTKFSGNVTVNRDNLEKSSVDATIEVASVSTASEARDNDLKTPNFFDAAKFPTITFKSTAWKKTGPDAYDITGDLTIHGVTKSVVLKAGLLGFSPGMQPGVQLTGWEATTILNKADFGVNGPAMLGTMLGNEVAVTINIEADLKQ